MLERLSWKVPDLYLVFDKLWDDVADVLEFIQFCFEKRVIVEFGRNDILCRSDTPSSAEVSRLSKEPVM